MTKQIALTNLHRNAAKVISDLRSGPVVVTRRGHPTAVMMDIATFAQIVRDLKEIQRACILELVRAGLADHKAGRVSSHAHVVRRIRKHRSTR